VSTFATTDTIGDLIRKLREVKDKRDELRAQDKPLAAQEDELEGAILRMLKDSGQSTGKVAGVGTATATDGWNVKYDPDKWSEIQKWAVESGNGHIFTRGLSSTRVMELVDSGVALPEGMSVEGFRKLSFRRT